MKLGIIITRTDPETVFNALRLAIFSRKQGDEVKVFLSGKGVEIDLISDDKFDVQGQARQFLDNGGIFLACGTCLKIRDKANTEMCPVSTLKDQYEMIRDSDKTVVF